MGAERKLHFISGLPRSGSTLLAALLRQNPAFAAGISSPVAVILSGLQQTLSGKSEYYSEVTDDKRRTFLREAVKAYFSDIEPERIVFDTNRLWCSKIATLVELFPNSKLICCVRSLAWVFDSFERIYRRNALQPSRMYNYEAFGNVYTRVDTLNHPVNGSVGASYYGLKEAFYGGYEERMILVTYESLAGSPEVTLKRLYAFLGEPVFEHHFDDLCFEAPDFDRAMGAAGLHTVRAKVSLLQRTAVLPPDLFRRFENSAFWNDDNPCHVSVI